MAGSGVFLAAGLAAAPVLVTAAGAQTATTTYAPPTSSVTAPAVSTTPSTAPPTTKASAGLAFTGADEEATIAGAAVLIGVGGLVVLGVRNRRRHSNDEGAV